MADGIFFIFLILFYCFFRFLTTFDFFFANKNSLSEVQRKNKKRKKRLSTVSKRSRLETKLDHGDDSTVLDILNTEWSYCNISPLYRFQSQLSHLSQQLKRHLDGNQASNLNLPFCWWSFNVFFYYYLFI